MLDATTAYVLGVVLVASLIRSTIGFGEALVAVPLLALCIPVVVAAPLAVMLSLLIAAVIVAQDWRHIEFRSASWLIASSLLGIPLGLLLVTRASDHVVKIILGLVIVGFALFSIAARGKWRLETDRRAWMLGAGFWSGILGGAYGLNGPPLVVYGALRQWSPQRFRATLQGYFLVASAAGLAGYAGIGLWRPPVTRYFLLSAPLAVVSIAVGRWLNRRLEHERFFRLVYAALLALGVILVGQALASWPA